MDDDIFYLQEEVVHHQTQFQLQLQLLMKERKKRLGSNTVLHMHLQEIQYRRIHSLGLKVDKAQQDYLDQILCWDVQNFVNSQRIGNAYPKTKGCKFNQM